MKSDSRTGLERIQALTPDQRRLLELRLKQGSQKPDMPPITPRHDRSWAPLSPDQERLWIIDQMVPGTIAFNVSFWILFKGSVDLPALRRSVEEIVRRHESLRTTFQWVKDRPIQRIHEPGELPVALEILDFSNLPDTERRNKLGATATELCNNPFELDAGPLMRTNLLRCDSSNHVLLVTIHHIVNDNISIRIFKRELAVLYEAFSGGEPSPLPELPVQYGDFAAWQHEYLQGERLEKLLLYWSRQLTDTPLVLALPTDRPRPLIQSFRGQRRYFSLPPDLHKKLTVLAEAERVSPFIFFLTVFGMLLHRYSGQDNFTVGSPFANRDRMKTRGLIGYLLNLLPIRIDLTGNLPFREILGRIRQSALGAYANHDLPFDKLLELLDPPVDLSRNPIFQNSFIFLDSDGQLLEPSEPINFSFTDINFQGTRFDLTLVIAMSSGNLGGFFEYNTDLFDESTIERLSSHYERILESVVSDPEVKVSAIDLLSDAERHWLLTERNATAMDYARDGSVVSEFARQVREIPEALAVEYAGAGLSYAELDAQSNRLAHWLRRRGVDRCTLVGVCLERSLELVIGILGVLKAGGGYVPLDADYPRERLEYMLRDTGAELVLCAGETVSVVSGLDVEAVDVEARRSEIERESTQAPQVDLAGGDVAYVMYTSGSTGWPKGVVVEHRSVLRLVRGANYVELGPGEVMLQLAPVSFDASTLELWGSLLNGGALVLYPRGVLSLAELGEFLVERGVSVLWLTAALFHRMVDEELELLRQVRQVLAGGEALTLSHVKRYLDGLPAGHRLVNGYGPTENTTFTCCYVMDAQTQVGDTVPIGRPVSNTRVYVLDGERSLVPVGVVGELYAGGDGLARGYLNQAELTAEKFVASPFAEGERLYRTGDRVRWRGDGVLEYMGREDHQVKLRGYRIELGEVEHALTSFDGVRDAVVLCREDEPGDKRLVAYVVAETDAVTAPTLRTYLQGRLPGYMLPSAIVRLESLPLTPVGKVDRDALPPPEGERQTEQVYVAPTSELEQRIAAIWRELLGVEQVGIDDNFFDLGGNSLLLMKLRNLLADRLQQELQVVDLFGFPSVRALTGFCAGQHADETGAPEQSTLGKAQARALLRRRKLRQRGQENKSE